MSEPQKIEALENSVQILTQLLASQQQRAALDASGGQGKSATLIEIEKRQAKVAAAIRPRVEVPPEGDGSDHVTITLGRSADKRRRDPDWHELFAGIDLHDPISDEYCSFGIACEIPAFIPARFFQGSFPRECAHLDRIMRAGLLTVRPGVVVDDPIVATNWGQGIGLAYLYAGDTQKNRITEDELLRVARLVDGAGCHELAKNLRHLAAGAKPEPSVFGLQAQPDFEL
jgi:hypothetical protein